MLKNRKVLIGILSAVLTIVLAISAILLFKPDPQKSMFDNNATTYTFSADYKLGKIDVSATGGKGKSVTLEKASTFDLNGKTLDLNGYTLKISDQTQGAVVTFKNGTIKNGALDVSVPNGDVEFNGATIAQTVTYDLEAASNTIRFSNANVTGKGTIKSDTHVQVDFSKLDDVSLEGNGSLTAGEGATLGKLNVSAKAVGAKILIAAKAKVENMEIAAKATVDIAGKVETVAVSEQATDAQDISVNVKAGAEVTSVELNAAAKVEVAGTVEKVLVSETAVSESGKAEVKVTDTAIVSNIDINAQTDVEVNGAVLNVTVGDKASGTSVNVEGEHATTGRVIVNASDTTLSGDSSAIQNVIVSTEIADEVVIPEGVNTTETNNIDQFIKEHKYDESERVDATCKEEGHVTYYCDHCQDSYQVTLPKLPHNYEKTNETDSTCKEEGEIEYTCSGCHDVKTEAIELKQHNYYIEVDRKEPTGTEDGYVDLKCDCGDVQRTTLTAHNCSEIHREEATCLADGYVEYKCNDEGCEYTYRDTLPQLNHKYEMVESKSYAETCGKDGKYVTACVNGCKDEKEQILPATGNHEYEEVAFYVEEATCLDFGKEQFKCKNCDDVHENPLPKKEHNFVKNTENSYDATCYASGMYVETCTNGCNESHETVLPQRKHVTKSEITKYPSEDESGLKVIYCTNEGCDYIIEKEIQAFSYESKSLYQLLSSLLPEGSYSLMVNEDSKINVYRNNKNVNNHYPSQKTMVEINIYEATITSKDGNLTGYMTMEFVAHTGYFASIFDVSDAELNDQNSDTTTIFANFYLSDGCAYVESGESLSEEKFGDDYYYLGFIDFESLEEIIKAFNVLQLPTELLDLITAENVTKVLSLIEYISVSLEEYIPFVEALQSALNGVEAPEGSESATISVEQILAFFNDYFISTEQVGDNTVYTITFENLAQISEIVATKTIKEFIEEQFGEGCIDTLAQTAKGIPDMTVEEIATFAIELAENYAFDVEFTFYFVETLIEEVADVKLNLKSLLEGCYELTITDVIWSTMSEEQQETFEDKATVKNVIIDAIDSCVALTELTIDNVVSILADIALSEENLEDGEEFENEEEFEDEEQPQEIILSELINALLAIADQSSNISFVVDSEGLLLSIDVAIDLSESFGIPKANASYSIADGVYTINAEFEPYKAIVSYNPETQIAKVEVYQLYEEDYQLMLDTEVDLSSKFEGEEVDFNALVKISDAIIAQIIADIDKDDVNTIISGFVSVMDYTLSVDANKADGSASIILNQNGEETVELGRITVTTDENGTALFSLYYYDSTIATFSVNGTSITNFETQTVVYAPSCTATIDASIFEKDENGGYRIYIRTFEDYEEAPEIGHGDFINEIVLDLLFEQTETSLDAGISVSVSTNKLDSEQTDLINLFETSCNVSINFNDENQLESIDFELNNIISEYLPYSELIEYVSINYSIIDEVYTITAEYLPYKADVTYNPETQIAKVEIYEFYEEDYQLTFTGEVDLSSEFEGEEVDFNTLVKMGDAILAQIIADIDKDDINTIVSGFISAMGYTLSIDANKEEGSASVVVSTVDYETGDPIDFVSLNVVTEEDETVVYSVNFMDAEVARFNINGTSITDFSAQTFVMYGESSIAIDASILEIEAGEYRIMLSLDIVGTVTDYEEETVRPFNSKCDIILGVALTEEENSMTANLSLIVKANEDSGEELDTIIDMALTVTINFDEIGDVDTINLIIDISEIPDFASRGSIDIALPEEMLPDYDVHTDIHLDVTIDFNAEDANLDGLEDFIEKFGDLKELSYEYDGWDYENFDMQVQVKKSISYKEDLGGDGYYELKYTNVDKDYDTTTTITGTVPAKNGLPAYDSISYNRVCTSWYDIYYYPTVIAMVETVNNESGEILDFYTTKVSFDFSFYYNVETKEYRDDYTDEEHLHELNYDCTKLNGKSCQGGFELLITCELCNYKRYSVESSCYYVAVKETKLTTLCGETTVTLKECVCCGNSQIHDYAEDCDFKWSAISYDEFEVHDLPAGCITTGFTHGEKTVYKCNYCALTLTKYTYGTYTYAQGCKTHVVYVYDYAGQKYLDSNEYAIQPFTYTERSCKATCYKSQEETTYVHGNSNSYYLNNYEEDSARIETFIQKVFGNKAQDERVNYIFDVLDANNNKSNFEVTLTHYSCRHCSKTRELFFSISIPSTDSYIKIREHYDAWGEYSTTEIYSNDVGFISVLLEDALETCEIDLALFESADYIYLDEYFFNKTGLIGFDLDFDIGEDEYEINCYEKDSTISNDLYYYVTYYDYSECTVYDKEYSYGKLARSHSYERHDWDDVYGESDCCSEEGWDCYSVCIVCQYSDTPYEYYTHCGDYHFFYEKPISPEYGDKDYTEFITNDYLGFEGTISGEYCCRCYKGSEITIKLEEDWTLTDDVYIYADDYLTLDLNGYNIDLNGYNLILYGIDGGDVTITDSTADGANFSESYVKDEVGGGYLIMFSYYGLIDVTFINIDADYFLSDYDDRYTIEDSFGEAINGFYQSFN